MSKERSPRKTFTAEIQLRNRYGGGEAPSGVMPAGIVASDPEVREEIEALKNEVSHLSHMLRTYVIPPEDEQKAADGEGEDSEDPLVKEFQKQRDEVRVLKMELRALANSIQETKREIAHLRTSDGEDDRLNIVAGELDAVVGATERATNGILEAAEKIDNAAQNVRTNSSDAYIQRLGEDISELVMGIFEHSNFQDITGQRITKVVNTLKFVEDRIDKMINIWGQETIDELLSEMPEGQHGEDDERRLLNGPQMEDEAISQGDIDKLFG